MNMDILGVLGLAALEMWLAFPVAYAVELSPLETLLTVGSGATLGTLAIAALGEVPRRFLVARFLEKRKVYARSSQLMNRFGIWAFSGLAPLLFGPPITTLVAYSLGAQPRKLLPLMLGGVWLWCAGIVLVVWLAR